MNVVESIGNENAKLKYSYVLPMAIGLSLLQNLEQL